MKAEFSASLLQSSVSHDPSEIFLIWWFAAQETFLVIINVGSIRAHIFVETVLFDEKKVQYVQYIQYLNICM